MSTYDARSFRLFVLCFVSVDIVSIKLSEKMSIPIADP